jgi:hypothetical protein
MYLKSKPKTVLLTERFHPKKCYICQSPLVGQQRFLCGSPECHRTHRHNKGVFEVWMSMKYHQRVARSHIKELEMKTCPKCRQPFKRIYGMKYCGGCKDFYYHQRFKRWYSHNTSKKRQLAKAEYYKNREKRLIQMRKYYHEHREELLAKKRFIRDRVRGLFAGVSFKDR